MKEDGHKELLEGKARRVIVSKAAAPIGVPPAVVLLNPKFDHNVGAAVRAASCFGIGQVWWTGRRVTLDVAKGERLPREERMKAYRDVQQIQFDRPFEQFPRGVVPVALDLFPNSEDLVTFEHPENAIYVFGPEDGGVDKVARSFCHRFVSIPTKACLNLAAAVNVVLYDRVVKSRR